MYVSSSDEEAGILIGLYTGTSHGDADYERALAAMVRADRAAAQRAIPYAHIMIVDAPSQPSPKWRQRFAEHNRSLTATSYYFGFVSSHAVVRGIFTAIRWLSGSREGHRTQALANIEEACGWLRSVSGRSYPQLEAMYERTRRAALSGQRTG
jgi:hypothetical protein